MTVAVAPLASAEVKARAGPSVTFITLLARRSSVSLWTGALLHLHSTFITSGVRNSDVHLDVGDTALSHVVCVGGPDHEDSHICQGHQQVLTSTRLPISATPCRLSEGHGDSLWDTWESLSLRVVLQEDAVSLENHIWLTVNHQ